MSIFKDYSYKWRYQEWQGRGTGNKWGENALSYPNIRQCFQRHLYSRIYILANDDNVIELRIEKRNFFSYNFMNGSRASRLMSSWNSDELIAFLAFSLIHERKRPKEATESC